MTKRRCSIKDSNNQHIITSHSPVFLDAFREHTVFHVRHDSQVSRVESCTTNRRLYEVLDALDCRASDILQANCVIWVEGPTDRMFLKKCFALLKYNWTEDTHFQIAFYGGSLRKHIKIDTEPASESVNDLVNLFRLSRNVAMVCDSDRKSEADDVNPTKMRLAKECQEASGFSWVTEGREIENYFSSRVLTKTWNRLLKTEDRKIELGPYDSLSSVVEAIEPVEGRPAWIRNYADNKVRLMEQILEDLTREDVEGNVQLMAKLSGLEEFIKNANTASLGVSDGDTTT